MIIHSGPLKKNQFKELIISKLNKLRGLFLLLFFGLPLAVYFPFQQKWFASGPIISGDITAGIAKVNTNDGSGSAFLVSPTKLITAGHVLVLAGLSEGDLVTLDFVKSTEKLMGIQAKVIFLPKEEKNDYAVLELLSPLNNVPTVDIGSANDASTDDRIKVIGFPGGLFSSTMGTISNNEVQYHDHLLQLDAGAWPGNSGGPVILESSNEVIGILIAGFEDQFKGITLAIKIDALLNDPMLKAKGIDLTR